MEAPNRPVCAVDAIKSRAEWECVQTMVNRASTGHKQVTGCFCAPGLTLLDDDYRAEAIVCALNRLWLKRTIDANKEPK